MADDPNVPPPPAPGTDPAAPPAPPKVTKSGKPKLTHYFCLEAAHPGAGGAVRADIFDDSRHFDSDEGGAPTCPLCKKPVSSLVVEDGTSLPPSIQLIKDRLAAAESNR